MYKESESNMYPWIDKTVNPLLGACPHQCSYCYVNSMKNRFTALEKRYSGSIRLDEALLSTSLGTNKTIFVCSMIDLFAEDVRGEYILSILQWLKRYPTNTYLLQSKNPRRMLYFVGDMPHKRILGTTIESNYTQFAKHSDKDMYLTAPTVHSISDDMQNDPEYRSRVLSNYKGRKMLSIEPIMFFHTEYLLPLIMQVDPEFISIGADSKSNRLYEPKAESIEQLVIQLREFSSIEVRLKPNLQRILGKSLYTRLL